jgi:hypothetical protein
VTKFERVGLVVFVILVVLIVVTALRAQNLPQPPKLTDAQKLSLREAQLDLVQVQVQMDQLEKQYRALDDQRKDKAEKLNSTLADILKSHHLEDWTVDKDLNLVKIPKEAKK